MIARRRMMQLAALGGVALWVLGLPRLPGLLPAEMSFTPIASSPPFRRLDRMGAASALNAAFAGITPSDLPDIDPCAALFDGAPTGIAVFADANCLNCPEMETNVIAAAEGSGLTIYHRNLPILGPSSMIAAQAIVAAENQPNGAAFRAALIKSGGVPAPRFISALTHDHGLDADRLRADMTAPATLATIESDRALARRLGLIGTPATVIGRTVLLGTLPERTIRQIIALEQQMDPPCS